MLEESPTLSFHFGNLTLTDDIHKCLIPNFRILSVRQITKIREFEKESRLHFPNEFLVINASCQSSSKTLHAERADKKQSSLIILYKEKAINLTPAFHEGVWLSVVLPHQIGRVLGTASGR